MVEIKKLKTKTTKTVLITSYLEGQKILETSNLDFRKYKNNFLPKLVYLNKKKHKKE